MTTYLESERLTLRPFAATDADLLIELDSDPAVMRYLTGGAPTPPEEVRDLAIPGILAGLRALGSRPRTVRGVREGRRRVRRLVLSASAAQRPA